MTENIQVAHPPGKPLLIYDGECNFCCFWIARWKQITGDRIDYLRSQDPRVTENFPELPRTLFDTAVQLIEPGGQVKSGALAVFQSLATNRAWRWPLACYRAIPSVARVTEFGYGLVARHRQFFSLVTRTLWGRDPALPRYEFTRWIFLRCLGLIYLLAFLSLWSQVHGLFGNDGILPAGQFVASAAKYFDQAHLSTSRYWLLPTWAWFGAGDRALDVLCGLGTLLSVVFFAGYAPALCAAALWSLYLSLIVIGRDFLSFQWDALLLETGFLAIFFSPLELRPRREREPPVSGLAHWLLKWLLFRLMFESGCVKLLSGDRSWWSLTALQSHYETQPLPTWIGWFVHQAPAHFQQACVGVLFGVELGLPFLIFGPRRLRSAAAAGFIILQLWILLTGNYGFFNYLTIILCVLLLDDAVLKARLRRSPALPAQGGAVPSQAEETANAGAQPERAGRLRTWPKWVTVPLLAIVLVVSGAQLLGMARFTRPWLRPAFAVAQWIAPFRTINSYGLFAVMTTSRPEILIEGSDDRVRWIAYDFKYKPGPLTRRPGFVAPHQPRLDWQMWFAALGSYEENPWLVQFCARLLQGSPQVLELLRANPFPEHPPRYIRARLADYRFTTWRERQETGAWWKSQPQGDYLPPISLEDFAKQAR